VTSPPPLEPVPPVLDSVDEPGVELSDDPVVEAVDDSVDASVEEAVDVSDSLDPVVLAGVDPAAEVVAPPEVDGAAVVVGAVVAAGLELALDPLSSLPQAANTSNGKVTAAPSSRCRTPRRRGANSVLGFMMLLPS
jgi:hypothetical protein